MANTKIPIELSSTPSIVDNGDATAITIDSSENVLIGTSSSSKNLRLQESFGIASTGALGGMAISGYSGTTAANRPLIDIQRSRGTSDESMTVVASGDYLGSLVFRGSDGTDFIDGAEISARVDGTPGTTDMPTNLTFHTQADGAGGAAAERMRITSAGKILMNHTSAILDETLQVRTNEAIGYGILVDETHSSGGTFMRFRVNGSIVGQIYGNGSATTYATSSDYRLKENISYDWDATTRLKNLKPARFNFKTDSSTTVDGFLAHEVSSVVPEAIGGEKDAVDSEGEPIYQSIDHSKLVPLLVKTIQELEARITTLEGG